MQLSPGNAPIFFIKERVKELSRVHFSSKIYKLHSQRFHNHLPGCYYKTPANSTEYHSKVVSGTKKQRTQWVSFVVQDVLGQRYCESDYWPDLVPIYWLYKRPQQILIETQKGHFRTKCPSCTNWLHCCADLLAAVSVFGFDVAACAPPYL